MQKYVCEKSDTSSMTALDPSQVFIIITVKHYCFQQSSLSVAAELFLLAELNYW